MTGRKQQVAFYKTDSVYIRNNIEEPTDFPFSKIIEKDYREAKLLEVTPFIYQVDKYDARIFLDQDGVEVLCQQKYLEILDDYTKYRYTQHSSMSQIYIWCGDELIGLILPIRVRETAKYYVVRS